MKQLHQLFITIRCVYRLAFFALVICCYFLTAIVYSLVTTDSIRRRQLLVSNASFYSRLMATAFNMSIICKNNIPADENSLVVGNHIGFVDIVALQASRGCVFITSTEMQQAVGLGQICDLAGCAYVNRRNRMNIQEELKGISEVLRQGFRVVLYAESVASNGEQVLPFKKTLLMSAGYAERPIRPFVFNFRAVNGGPVLYSHRDSLCWYGDDSFLEAIWRSLKLNSVVVEIEFLPLIYTTADQDRSEIARDLHQAISNRFIPFKRPMELNQEQNFEG